MYVVASSFCRLLQIMCQVLSLQFSGVILQWKAPHNVAPGEGGVSYKVLYREAAPKHNVCSKYFIKSLLIPKWQISLSFYMYIPQLVKPYPFSLKTLPFFRQSLSIYTVGHYREYTSDHPCQECTTKQKLSLLSLFKTNLNVTRNLLTAPTA